MPRRDLSTRDASHYEAGELQYALNRKKREADNERKLTLEEALQEERLARKRQGRNITRVLFISQDTTLLNPTTQTLDGYLDLSDLFEEVHVLILRTGIPAKNPVLRVDKNVWLYTASAKSWWRMVGKGKELIENELVFVGGLRPDLIIARDPFESALVAKAIASRFNTPAQLHLFENYTTREFKELAPQNFWRRYIPRYVVPFFKSIRVDSQELYDLVEQKAPVPDLAILPRYHSYEALKERPEKIDLKEIYKPFNFFMLYVGELNHDSLLYQVIDAARFALENRRVGLLVIGSGPAKKEFFERAKVLGVEKQIVFLGEVEDIVPYLKACNMLIMPEARDKSEEVVLQAAALELPLILSATAYRKDVFPHEEAAHLYEPGDVQALADGINLFLNDYAYRRQLALGAAAVIEEEFHQNINEYRRSYRQSLEDALFIEEAIAKQTEGVDTEEQ